MDGYLFRLIYVAKVMIEDEQGDSKIKSWSKLAKTNPHTTVTLDNPFSVNL